jgi:UDPglucose--hexose-1-phosphate uridylyltransferase
MVRQESKSRVRVVFENDRFISFTPFASRFPYELKLVPKLHSEDFGRISESDIRSLSEALKESICRIIRVLDNPAFNYIVHTSPVNGPAPEWYHWHIEIITRLTRVAGFEWGTGFYVNPISPEEACRRLKEGEL